MAPNLATNQKKKKTKNKSLEDVKTLGEQLLSSRANINNLPLLLTFISPSFSSELVIESTTTLQSFFIPALPDLPSSSSKPSFHGGKSSKDPELVYRTWLRSQFDDFVKSLIALTVSSQSNETLIDVALDAIMEFVKLGKGGRFQSAIYHRFINAVVHSTFPVDFLLEMLVSKYFKYIDVRYYTYISLEKFTTSLDTTDMTDNIDLNVDGSDDHISRSSNAELAIHKIHYILSHIPPLEIQEEKTDYEMWSESGLSSKENDGKGSTDVSHVDDNQHKSKKHNNAVMSTAQIAKKMKLKFTRAWLSFLRLKLPLDVYKELVDSCLKSPLLPAYLAAAFAKKLSRLVLVIPPSGALIIIALIHNLLRRHPSINCLVHQQADDENDKEVSTGEIEFGESAKETNTSLNTSSTKPGIDHFNNEESDPAKSNALRSSLWEIDTLRHHYCPAVSRFVLSLENDLTVRAKTTELNVKDFSSGSYATIFREATGRRIKQVPLAFYQKTPTSLFSEGDFAGWTFNDDSEKMESGNAITEEDNHKSAKRQRVKSS